MAWRSGADHVVLTTRPADATYTLVFTTDDTTRTITDIAELAY